MRAYDWVVFLTISNKNEDQRPMAITCLYAATWTLEASECATSVRLQWFQQHPPEVEWYTRWIVLGTRQSPP